MSYKLNNVDLTLYGIFAGRISGGNIAVSGIYDMPKRAGDTFHDWADENGVESYTDADEIFFDGRDIVFKGLLQGTRSETFEALNGLYSAISAFTGTVVFSTPFGDFNVLVKSIEPTHYSDITEIEIKFREPVVNLTGTLPSPVAGFYSIDNISLTSFGLYVSKQKELSNLPEAKTQYFKKYGSVGFQITKRKNNTLKLTGLLIGNDISDFTAKVKSLYKLFSSPGERTFNLANEVEVNGFAVDGFKVTNIHVSSKVTAIFSIDILITDFAS